MGRGRARAKQQKVARELKYRSVSTDFSSLERELRGQSSDSPTPADEIEEYDEEYDEYSEYDDDDDDEDDEGAVAR